MKCPFCFNTMELSDVHTDDCWRVCMECSNCGLRCPGGEETDIESALQFAKELHDTMLPVWNPDDLHLTYLQK